jgi:hypothetical protein
MLGVATGCRHGADQPHHRRDSRSLAEGDVEGPTAILAPLTGVKR